MTMKAQTVLSTSRERAADPLFTTIRELYTGKLEQEGRWQAKQNTDPPLEWVQFTCKDTNWVQQGWKLHISASTSSAETILRRVLPLLFGRSSHFKVLASLQELAKLNQGIYGYNQIGKYITIYPRDDQEAVELALQLDEATRGLAGPKIPSDRPLRPGSLVHYRYGQYRGGLYVQEPGGMIEPAIRTPENKLVPDRRRLRYEVPDWVVDPFAASGIAVDLPTMSRFIGDRYLLVGTVTSSPLHTIYLAADLQVARTCIVKGPGLAWECGTSEDPINKLLLNEAAMLSRLAPDPHIPALYDLIEHDGALFLVLEDIPGETLATTVNRAVETGQLFSIAQVIAWGKELAAILDKIHKHGLVYADLKSSNVILGTDDRLHLVDFELTSEQKGQGLRRYGTPGYIAPQRQQGEPLTIADDIFSFGALLYFLITGVEPSKIPGQRTLMERPPELFRSNGAVLTGILARCLHERPEERYGSMAEVSRALDAVNSLPFQLTEPDKKSEMSSDETREHYYELSRRLLDTICTQAHHSTDQGELFWKSTHPLTYGLASRDLNTGNAGTLLALAELVVGHPAAQKHAVLAAGAQWLIKTSSISEQPLPGLYVGEAGVGAALLRAGQIGGDQDLISTASERGRLVSSLPFGSPDLFNGTAGRLRFHLLLWDETGEREHLQAAKACGEQLLLLSERRADQEICWTISEGYRGLSEKRLAGYAHGAAGIADALLDLFEATGDERYLQAAYGAARWLTRLAIPLRDDGYALNWPTSEGNQPAAAFWCHGSAGIGRFFLHAAQLLPDAIELAERAARTVASATRWAGPTQCHGLAGNIEFLLDMYQETKDRSYLEDAFLLGRCLETFATEHNGLLVFSSESPTTFTPDYMVGYAGIAVCLLRLSLAESMPHQLSRRGFRFAGGNNFHMKGERGKE